MTFEELIKILNTIGDLRHSEFVYLGDSGNVGVPSPLRTYNEIDEHDICFTGPRETLGIRAAYVSLLQEKIRKAEALLPSQPTDLTEAIRVARRVYTRIYTLTSLIESGIEGIRTNDGYYLDLDIEPVAKNIQSTLTSVIKKERRDILRLFNLKSEDVPWENIPWLTEPKRK